MEHAKKFDQEAKDRLVRLVEDRILTENVSMQAACQAIAPKLGVSSNTARQWTSQARRENQELRDTNELLKAASAFFALQLDPKRRK